MVDADGVLLAEHTAQGALLRNYIYLNGAPFATVDAAGAVRYILNDHLGQPQAMLDSAGAVTWRRVAGLFGDTVSQPVGNTGDNPLRFPGQQFDAATGLHYNYFRNYDPLTGRYLEPDPIGLKGGINLYAYAKNDPVNYQDPTGQSPVGAIAGALAGGLAGFSVNGDPCATLNDRLIGGLAGALGGAAAGALTDNPVLAGAVGGELGSAASQFADNRFSKGQSTSDSIKNINLGRVNAAGAGGAIGGLGGRAVGTAGIVSRRVGLGAGKGAIDLGIDTASPTTRGAAQAAGDLLSSFDAALFDGAAEASQSKQKCDCNGN